MTIKELQTSGGQLLSVKDGSSSKVTATMHDYDGTAIVKAALLTLTMTLKDGSGNVVNLRDEVDIKDANGGFVATNGTLTLYLDEDDNTRVDDTKAAERRILLLRYTWNDGVADDDQVGIDEYHYVIDSTSDAA